MNYEKLESHALNMRRNIVSMVARAKSGHPGGSLSAVEIMVDIYFNQMNIDASNVLDKSRDKFVLSKGHASPVLYAVLAEKGLITQEDLLTFRFIDSKIQGHPNMNYVDGIDMSTGSLGQGLSAAVGMSLANKIDNNDFKTFVLIGDGESQEGQIWEAAMAASHYKLNNLCAVLDFNGLQIDGDITKVMNPTPFDTKFEAFGWNVIELVDSYDFKQIDEAFNQAKLCLDKPSIIIAHTVKGKGISFMENNAAWHGSAPNNEQLEIALSELGGNK